MEPSGYADRPDYRVDVRRKRNLVHIAFYQDAAVVRIGSATPVTSAPRPGGGRDG